LAANFADVKKRLSSYMKVTNNSSSGNNSNDFGAGGGNYVRRAKKAEVDQELEKLFNSLSNANLPLASQPQRIETELLPHQLSALHWMQQREGAKKELPPFWSAKTGVRRLFCVPH
jgi:hypothetical protein